MWMILLHFTPMVACITLAAMAASALILARQSIKKDGYYRSPMRAVLGVATIAYLLILAAPILSWDQVGTGDRYIEWNVFSSLEEIEQNNNTEPEMDFGQILSNKESVYYSPNELTTAEKEQQLELSSYDYFVHDGGEGQLVVVDHDGQDVPLEVRSLVAQEMVEHISYSNEPSESAALIFEEKVVNAFLFIPVGIVAFHAFSSWTARLLFGPGLSVTIEAIQWAMAAGRSADAGDVVVNTAGSLVGVALAGVAVMIMGLRKGQNREKTPSNL